MNPASDFKYDLNEDGTGIVITRYIGDEIEVIIPSSIEGFPVVALGDTAFTKTGILSIVIPDSVIDIYDGWYSDYEEIDRGGYLQFLPYTKGCFTLCKDLVIVKLPKSLKRIPTYCFYKCKFLVEIELPQGLEEIGEYAFSGTSFFSIIIPNSVKRIKNEAFSQCTNLIYFDIKGKEINYSYNVFQGCSSLSLKERAKIKKTGYKGGF